MIEIPPPRATRDCLPEEAAGRRHVLARFAETAESYGFQPIETPSFEKVELFLARSGSEIKGSLLTFHCDHEEFALRPELTAPVCRLLASGAFEDAPKPYRLYYTGSCYRYCRPGSGRYREFTQAGIELLGQSGAEADAEVIAAACRFLRNIGVGDFQLKLGTVGVYRDLLSDGIDAEDRSTVLGHLDWLVGIRERAAALAGGDSSVLDELKLDRKETAVMQERSGYEGEHSVAARGDLGAADIAAALPAEAEAAVLDCWSKEGYVDDAVAAKLIAVSRLRGDLDSVAAAARPLLDGTPATAALEDLLAVARQVHLYGIKEFEVVLGIARGLTFYTGSVFEISSPGGKKYGGGGRYDALVELFGGESTPAVGCAFRFDELMDAFESSSGWNPPKAFQLYLVAASSEAALQVAEELRNRGLRVGVGAQAPAAGQAETVGEVQPDGSVRLSGGATVALDASALADSLQ